MAEAVIERVKTSKDFYDVLGISRDADETLIKKSYRKLALLLHPDKCSCPGAEDAFKKVSEAYSCLSSSSSRQNYDAYGSSGPMSAGNQFDGVDPNELFRQFFEQHQHGGGTGGMHRQTFFFSTGGPSGFQFPSQSGPRDMSSNLPPFLKFLVPLFSVLPMQIVIPLFAFLFFFCLKFFISIVWKHFYLYLAINFLSPPQFKWRLMGLLFIVSLFL